MHTLSIEKIIGSRYCDDKFKENIKIIAQSNYPVLILGETGVGKEVLAKLLVSYSKRFDKKLVSINCGAIPETLLETTLFGHKKGAYTSAFYDSVGCFEEANGGTLFLDEIAETSTHFQTALLRVLDNGIIRRIGGVKDILVDTRLIFATNKNICAEVEKGNFREDLYYRINPFEITIPPLRERTEDIETLIHYYIKIIAENIYKNPLHVAPETLDILKNHYWKENIRQLINVLQHSVVMAAKDTLMPDDLPKSLLLNKTPFSSTTSKNPEIDNYGAPISDWFSINSYDKAKEEMYLELSSSTHFPDLSYDKVRIEFEKKYFVALLKHTKGNISEMANISKMGRKSIYRKLNLLDINIDDYRDNM